MNDIKLSFFLTFLLSVTLSLDAANLDQIKGEMKQRQPAIEALWVAGKIGESNKGYVEALGDLSAGQEQLLKDENADRKIVYEAIARSANTTPSKVGVQRAAQISERAAKGLWLQDADGQWYQKK